MSTVTVSQLDQFRADWASNVPVTDQRLSTIWGLTVLESSPAEYPLASVAARAKLDAMTEHNRA